MTRPPMAHTPRFRHAVLVALVALVACALAEDSPSPAHAPAAVPDAASPAASGSLPAHTAEPVQTPPMHTPVAETAPAHTPIAEPAATPAHVPAAQPQATPVDPVQTPPMHTPIAETAPAHTPIAEPAATPAHVPAAQPQATPAHTPEAKPSDAPIVEPEATPAHAPTAQPGAAPVHTPVAQPEATPTHALAADAAADASADAAADAAPKVQDMRVGVGRFPHPAETPDASPNAAKEKAMMDAMVEAEEEEEWGMGYGGMGGGPFNETEQEEMAQHREKLFDEQQQFVQQHRERAIKDLDEAEPSANKDDNPSCHNWAIDGECIRNPQFMWMACAVACSSLKYVDAEEDCSGWAQHGECEKNPAFMFERCNQSCVVIARKGVGHGEHHARPNPHMLGVEGQPGGEEGSHRASTFVPIFVGVLVLLVGGAALATAFAPFLTEQAEALEDYSVRLSSRLQRRFPAAAPYLLAINVNKVATSFICIYYLNESLTVLQTNPLFAAFFPLSSDGVWQQHVAWVDASNLMGGAAAICCLVGVRPLSCAVVMLGDTLVDSYLLLWRIGMNFLYGRGLYINELMAKKFSLLGCVALLIAAYAQDASQTSFSGMLLETRAVSNRTSLALLLGRLLIAVLFLYVGLSELHRLLFQPFTPYLPGDGHDVVWPKAVELLLALPFIVGVKTESVSRLLALSLVLEALYAWSWWRIPGDPTSFAHHRRAIHYREHFVTNLATAGGLLFLQKMGPGKYTVDELLKKAD